MKFNVFQQSVMDFPTVSVYESEQAPEACKEKARQHPRASPVIPERHVLSSSVNTGVEREKEKPLSPSNFKRIIAHPTAPSKTMSDNNKAAPSSSKSKNLSVSKPTELQVSSAPSTSGKASSALSSPKAPRAKMASSQTFYDASMPPHASSAPVTPRGGDKSSSRSDLIWDKGISVREYLKNKFEPGEEERALSEVISEVMSPRKTPQDKGVMEKVKDAVTSLLLNDEPSQHVAHSLSTSSEIPVSTNACEGQAFIFTTYIMFLLNSIYIQN